MCLSSEARGKALRLVLRMDPLFGATLLRDYWPGIHSLVARSLEPRQDIVARSVKLHLITRCAAPSHRHHPAPHLVATPSTRPFNSVRLPAGVNREA